MLVTTTDGSRIRSAKSAKLLRLYVIEYMSLQLNGGDAVSLSFMFRILRQRTSNSENMFTTLSLIAM